MICGGLFDVSGREETITKLEHLSAGGAFWDDQQQAQKVLKQLSDHRAWVEAYRKIESGLHDLEAMVELAGEGGFTESELDQEYINYMHEFENLEMRAMLTGPDDARAAIVHIHPGAGGTESNDWA